MKRRRPHTSLPLGRRLATSWLVVGWLALGGVLSGCEGEGPWVWPATVDGASAAVRVRVAIVWSGADEAGVRRVAQDVPLLPGPGDARLVVARPPAEAFAPQRFDRSVGPPSLSVATGRLVVYEDANGNGALDLAEGADAEPSDRVVGPADTWVAVYLPDLPRAGGTVWVPDASYAPALPDGWEIAPADLAPGLSLLRVDRPNVMVRDRATPVVTVPPGAAVRLRLADDARLQSWMCSWRVRSEAVPGVEDVGAVAPEDVPWDAARLHVECTDDGRALRFHARFEPEWPAPGGPCAARPEVQWVGTAALAGGAAPPQEWPCTP